MEYERKWKESVEEDDFYSAEAVEDCFDCDMIDGEEYGFMQGYLDA